MLNPIRNFKFHKNLFVFPGNWEPKPTNMPGRIGESNRRASGGDWLAPSPFRPAGLPEQFGSPARNNRSALQPNSAQVRIQQVVQIEPEHPLLLPPSRALPPRESPGGARGLHRGFDQLEDSQHGL